jgi:hypothetical protein
MLTLHGIYAIFIEDVSQPLEEYSVTNSRQTDSRQEETAVLGDGASNSRHFMEHVDRFTRVLGSWRRFSKDHLNRHQDVLFLDLPSESGKIVPCGG